MLDLTGQVAVIPAPVKLTRRWDDAAAWTIAAVTGSGTHHVVTHVGRGMVASAEPGGVRLRPVSDYPVAVWSRFRLPGYAAGRAADWARAQVGTPYAYADDLMIGAERVLGVRFPRWVRARYADTGQFQCAQLATYALMAADVNPFPDRDTIGDVTPGDFEALFIRNGWHTPAEFKPRAVLARIRWRETH